MITFNLLASDDGAEWAAVWLRPTKRLLREFPRDYHADQMRICNRDIAWLTGVSRAAQQGFRRLKIEASESHLLGGKPITLRLRYRDVHVKWADGHVDECRVTRSFHHDAEDYIKLLFPRLKPGTCLQLWVRFTHCKKR